jgi:hypothetical protein
MKLFSSQFLLGSLFRLEQYTSNITGGIRFLAVLVDPSGLFCTDGDASTPEAALNNAASKMYLRPGWSFRQLRIR